MSAERELTGGERAAIKKLVISMCANYDSAFGCLPLDYGRCYMLDKWLTGGYCMYFQNAVLPLDSALEATLTGREMPVTETRPCAICGKPFPAHTNNQLYCSALCAGKAHKKRNRENMRKSRGNRVYSDT